MKEVDHIGLAKYETAIKAGGLQPGRFEGHRTTVYFTVNPLGQPREVQGSRGCEASPRRNRRWRARTRRTSSSTLPRRHLLQHDRHGIHPNCHPRKGQGRDLRDSRRSGTHAAKKNVSDSTVENTKSTFVEKVIGKDTLREETQCSIQKNPPTKWQFIPNQESPDLESRGHLEEDEQDLIKSPVPALHHGKCRERNIQCFWREAANTDARTRGASP